VLGSLKSAKPGNEVKSNLDRSDAASSMSGTVMATRMWPRGNVVGLRAQVSTVVAGRAHVCYVDGNSGDIRCTGCYMCATATGATSDRLVISAGGQGIHTSARNASLIGCSNEVVRKNFDGVRSMCDAAMKMQRLHSGGFIHVSTSNEGDLVCGIYAWGAAIC